ncbi:MAG: tetratricopeptide repeat protein, partial [Fibrobacteres bacterium]|nr:tetratricopeptide repeat protein [Fibrobacterota bacterium]
MHTNTIILISALCIIISGCAGTAKNSATKPSGPITEKRYSGKIDSTGRDSLNDKGIDTASVQKLSAATQLLLGAINNYIDVVPTSKRIPEIIMLKGHTYYNNRLYDKAREAYIGIVDHHKKTGEYSEAIKMTAQTFYEEKKYSEAQEWYRKLKDAAVSGVDKEEAAVRLTEAYFRQGEALKAAGDITGSIDQFERIYIEFPSAVIADAALYNVALMREEKREWTQAILSHNKLLANYPKSKFLEPAYFRIAKDYEQLNNWSRAAATYLEAIKRFPGSSQVKDAVYNAAIAYEKSDDFSAAAKLFERYATEWPTDKDAPDVLFKAGELFGKLEDWSNVERINSMFSRKYGNDKERIVMAICMTGIASYMQKKYDQAALELERAIETGKKAGLNIKANSFYAAKAQFTIGEIRQLQAEQITLDGGDYNLKLKNRIKRIEEAVSAYTRVSNYKLIEWTVKAIYRIGETYEQFGTALFKRDRPKNLPLNKLLDLEEGIAAAIEKYLAVKALEAHEQNVNFGLQYQYEDEWTKRSRQQLTKLPNITAKNYVRLIDIASSTPIGDSTQGAMKLIQKTLERLQLIAPYQDKAIALSLKTLEMAAKYDLDDKYKSDASAAVTKLSFDVGETYAEIVALARSAPIPPSYDGYKRFFYKVHLLGEGLVEYENLAITSLYKNIKIGEAYGIKDSWIKKSKEKIAEVLFTRSMCYEILSQEALRTPPIPEGVTDVEAEEYQLQFEDLGYKLQDEAYTINRDILDKAKNGITSGPYADASYSRMFLKFPSEVGEKIERDTMLSIRTEKDWLYIDSADGEWWALDYTDTAWKAAVKGQKPDTVSPAGFLETPATIWGADSADGKLEYPQTIFMRRYFRTATTPRKASLEFAMPGPYEIRINGNQVATDSLNTSLGWY